MESTIPVTSPDDFNSILDVLKYAWILGAYWGKQFMDRLKKIEDKQATSPTHEQVETRVEKEMAKVTHKLDRIEKMIWDLGSHRSTKPHYDLGDSA